MRRLHASTYVAVGALARTVAHTSVRRLASACALVSVLATGCRDAPLLEPETGYRVRIVSGDQQRAPAGAALASLLTVLVENRAGNPEPGVRVRFTVTRGGAAGAAADGGSGTVGGGAVGGGAVGGGAVGGGAVGSYLADGISVTDQLGRASARLVLGAALDTTWVEAALATVDGVAIRFSAVAIAAPTVTSVSPAAFRAGDTLRVSGSRFVPGITVVRIGSTLISALAGASATEVRAVVPPCLTAGATSVAVAVGGAPSNAFTVAVVASRAAIQLRTFEAVTVPAAQLSDCITLGGEPGATYLVSAQSAAGQQPVSLFDWRLGAAGSVAGSVADAPVTEMAAAASRADHSWAQRQFESNLRQLEHQVAAPARAEQAAYAARGASSSGGTGAFASRAMSRSVAVPDVGSTRQFSVVAAVDGSRFASVTARLRFAGDHILVYTDTMGSTLTDTRITALATLMDRDLYPLTVNAFGAESDVDGNGRVIVLLTPVVNALAKADDCVQRGYVTGFFYGVDVLERAEGSNRGEVFYGLVPDSTGRHSCAHQEADVVRTLQGTFAHELQHLISFNQHVLARGGDTEETWLNEGLSHMAEELASRLFEMRYPAPLGRSTTAQLFPDSAAPFIAPQLLNAYVYLNSTLQHSVTSYDGTGSVEERGATWLFLRWLGDQKGDAIFRQLVEAPVTGVANVERATGERFGALFGDFSLALVADSIPGISRSVLPPRQRFLSRNLRQLMAREAVVAGFTNPFPLPTYVLAVGGSLRSAMLPGTMMHAIVRTEGTGTPIRLAFTTPGLAPLAPAVAGQVSIMRLPP